mgnify:CR=1 FL=1
MKLKAAGLYNSSDTQLVNTSGKALTAGHADTATTAGTCTGNAATATTAGTCTGNAATASNISGFTANSTAMFAPTTTTGGVFIYGNNARDYNFDDFGTTNEETGRFTGLHNEKMVGGSIGFHTELQNYPWEAGMGRDIDDLVIFNVAEKSNGQAEDFDVIIFTSGNFHVDDSVEWSDDRLKHNETIVTNALEDIRKLVPMKYFKTRRLYDANHHFELDNSGNPIDNSGNPIKQYKIETGLIAQSVLKIDNLKHAVKKKKGRNKLTGQEYPYAVNYKYIFVHAISALKELDAEHSSTKQELESLKTKVADLESKVELLMNERNA